MNRQRRADDINRGEESDKTKRDINREEDVNEQRNRRGNKERDRRREDMERETE